MSGGGRDAGWPVLARLPRVGPLARPPREPGPSFSSGSNAEAETPLRVDFGPTELGDHWRFAVDAAHEGRPMMTSPATASTPATAAIEPPREFEATPVNDAQPARHYRVDRGVESLSVGRGPHARRESESLSASIFRLHAALAPHMGAAATAALVITACLLYWLAAGRSGAGVDSAQPAELEAEWTPSGGFETREPATAPSDGLDPSREVNAQAGASIAAPPAAARLADASAGVVSANNGNTTTPMGGALSTNATELSEPPAATINGPAATVAPPGNGASADPAASMGPSLEPPAVTHEVPRTVTDEDDPIGPTGQGDSYPITSYPPFSFDAPAIAQAPVSSVDDAPGAHAANVVR